MKKVLFKILFYLTATVFLSFLFGFTVLKTMDILIKGKEVKTPDFLNLTLIEARQKAFKEDVRLKELPLNSELSQPETVISQYPKPGSLIKESGNRIIKIYYTPKKTEIIMPDLSRTSINECKKILDENNLRGYFAYIYSDTAPADYVVSQTYVTGTRLKKGTRVGVLISRGIRSESFIMPEIIGDSADDVMAFFEDKGIQITKISYRTYEGLEPGIIINQSPRQGYRINRRSIIELVVSE